jgi:hypothetical protein
VLRNAIQLRTEKNTFMISELIGGNSWTWPSVIPPHFRIAAISAFGLYYISYHPYSPCKVAAKVLQTFHDTHADTLIEHTMCPPVSRFHLVPVKGEPRHHTYGAAGHHNIIFLSRGPLQTVLRRG